MRLYTQATIQTWRRITIINGNLTVSTRVRANVASRAPIAIQLSTNAAQAHVTTVLCAKLMAAHTIVHAFPSSPDHVAIYKSAIAHHRHAIIMLCAWIHNSVLSATVYLDSLVLHARLLLTIVFQVYIVYLCLLSTVNTGYGDRFKL